MNKEICQRCINNKDCKRYVNTVCEVCHQIENAGNGSNQLFLEFLSETPECCGKWNNSYSRVNNLVCYTVKIGRAHV